MGRAEIEAASDRAVRADQPLAGDPLVQDEVRRGRDRAGKDRDSEIAAASPEISPTTGEVGPTRDAKQREQDQKDRVRIPRHHDQRRDDSERDRTATRGTGPPPLDEEQPYADQEERERMAERAVEHAVVKEIGSPRNRGKGRQYDGAAEMRSQDPSKHCQARDHVHEACEAGRVLVIERKAVARKIRPRRQRVRDEKKRRHRYRGANRMQIQPASGGGPPADAAEFWKDA